MRKIMLALGAAMALVAAPAAAHEVTAGDLTVIHPMARPHTAGRPTAAYMAIANDGTVADRLIAARSPGFEAVELHESVEQDGVSRMRPVETLEIPAEDTVLLEPGGLHLMLFGADAAHADGNEFPLILIFENAGEVVVPVMISRTGIDAGDAEGMQHGGHGSHAHD